MSSLEHVTHPFAPEYDSASQILILGSFPSVQSRKQNFYYAHPQNRFWKVLGEIFNEEVGSTAKQKKAFLKSHHIALWDVIEQCSIHGSSDSSIRDVTPTNLSSLLEQSEITTIFCNGKKALQLFDRYQKPNGLHAIYLPSSSPANAAFRLDKLVEVWKPLILDALKKEHLK